jgi:hypothetical protein
MAHDVFISFAVEDETTAETVCATLEASGIRCWIAPRDVLPGVDYAQAIVEAITQSRIMVLLFSSRSNHSPHVKREVERAVSRGIPILPFRIEDVPLSPSLEYFIGTVHWLDALTPPLEKHLQHLAETVRLLLSRVEKPGGVAVVPEATKRAPTAETTMDKGLHWPMLLQDAYGIAKRWVSRPLVQVAVIFGAVVVAVVVAAILVPIGLLPGDDGGLADSSATPDDRLEGAGVVAYHQTPTPTPTPTPTSPTLEGPELGTYTGTTSQGRPLEFDVVEEGRAIGRIKIDVEGTCSGLACACEVQRETTLGRPVSIVDDTFSYSEDDFDILGTFDSITTASGHLNVHTSGTPGTFPPPCERDSVTWTASVQ